MKKSKHFLKNKDITTSHTKKVQNRFCVWEVLADKCLFQYFLSVSVRNISKSFSDYFLFISRLFSENTDPFLSKYGSIIPCKYGSWKTILARPDRY